MSKLLHIGMSLTAMQTNLVPTSSEPSSPSATATAAAHSHKGINRACLPNLVLSNQLSILESLIDAKLELESNDGIKELEQVTYRYLQSDKARVGDSDGSCLLGLVRDTVGQYCKERVKKVLGKFKRRVPRTLTLDHLNRIHEQMQWRGEVPDEELVNYWYWHRNIKHQIDDLEEFCDRDVKALEHRELGDEFLRIFNDVLAESRNGKTVNLFAHGTAAAAAGPESMTLTSGPIAEQSTTFIGRDKEFTKEAKESHQPQLSGTTRVGGEKNKGIAEDKEKGNAAEDQPQDPQKRKVVSWNTVILKKSLPSSTAAGEENETRK